MKKILTLIFALMAIFCIAQAQNTTSDSFYQKDQFMKNYPQDLIELKDKTGIAYGFILVYSEDQNVTIFYVPAEKKEVRKGSREEKKVVKMIMSAYRQYVSKQEVKIKEKVHREKKLNCIVLEKQNI